MFLFEDSVEDSPVSDESIPPPSQATPEEATPQPAEARADPIEQNLHPFDRDPDYDRLLLTRGQDFDLDYTLLVPVLRAHERQQLDLKGCEPGESVVPIDPINDPENTHKWADCMLHDHTGPRLSGKFETKNKWILFSPANFWYECLVGVFSFLSKRVNTFSRFIINIF